MYAGLIIKTNIKKDGGDVFDTPPFIFNQIPILLTKTPFYSIIYVLPVKAFYIRAFFA